MSTKNSLNVMSNFQTTASRYQSDYNFGTPSFVSRHLARKEEDTNEVENKESDRERKSEKKGKKKGGRCSNMAQLPDDKNNKGAKSVRSPS